MTDSAATTVDDRPIVVGVDGSESARDAAAWAADLAAIWGSPLHLLTVGPGPGAGRLTGLREAAERDGAHPVVVETAAAGGLMDVLADRARGARMLVLGSYGDGAWSGMIAGEVALTMLDRVGCPVAVVRGTTRQVPPPRGGPVVVGVDGSSAGGAALALAADLAVSWGARLVAVHAWSDIAFGVDGAARRRPEDGAVLAGLASALLDAELATIRPGRPGLVVERSVVADTPLRALLAAADGARMVVVGHRGAGAGPGRSLGSTSRALVEFVPCPVVVAGHGADTVAGTRTARAAGVSS
jgi:nucleotide-binding universal stress UspA family protein